MSWKDWKGAAVPLGSPPIYTKMLTEKRCYYAPNTCLFDENRGNKMKEELKKLEVEKIESKI